LISTADTLHVVFRVGNAEYVLPASVVTEMESYAGATPVPGAAPYVAGIVQIRGNVVPVIDLRARFGFPSLERTLDHRVVVIEEGGRRVGLLVESARQVTKIAKEAFRPPPELVVEQGRGFVKAVAQVGEKLVMLLDCAKVIEEENADGRKRQFEQ
jgi:purine-binding chemotaxis protein CheW